MKLLKVFNGEQPLFVEENNKKYKKNLNEINKLINALCTKYNEYSEFLTSPAHTEEIALAKGLNELFNTKRLRLDLVLENQRRTESAKINEFTTIKAKLLNELNTINNPVEAVVCLYSLEGKEFVLCENGKELVILGEHNNIIGQIVSIIEGLHLESNLENVEPHQPSYNTATLERNVNMCRERADEVYATKQNRLTKIMEVIEKLQEVGEKVVAFYSYKERLITIGCNTKAIKDYESELEKMYMPLKKTLQKELKIELEEICEIPADENEYHPAGDNLTDEDLDKTLELSNESPIEESEIKENIDDMFGVSSDDE